MFSKKIIKILIALILVFSSISLTSAYKYEQINNYLDKYYTKLDNKISDTQKKIDTLDKIKDKIDKVFKVKWNNLSRENKQLLMLIKSSLVNKIRFYEKELEEIDISQLFVDVEEEKINIKNINISFDWDKTLAWNKIQWDYTYDLFIWDFWAIVWEKNKSKYIIPDYAKIKTDVPIKIELSVYKNWKWTAVWIWKTTIYLKWKVCFYNWEKIKDWENISYMDKVNITNWYRHNLSYFKCDKWELVKIDEDFKYVSCNSWFIPRYWQCEVEPSSFKDCKFTDNDSSFAIFHSKKQWVNKNIYIKNWSKSSRAFISCFDWILKTEQEGNIEIICNSWYMNKNWKCEK